MARHPDLCLSRIGHEMERLKLLVPDHDHPESHVDPFHWPTHGTKTSAFCLDQLRMNRLCRLLLSAILGFSTTIGPTIDS